MSASFSSLERILSDSYFPGRTPKSGRTSYNTNTFSRGQETKINGNRSITRGCSWTNQLSHISRKTHGAPFTLFGCEPSLKEQKKVQEIWKSYILPNSDWATSTSFEMGKDWHTWGSGESIAQLLHLFSTAAKTNCCKYSGFKQHIFILVQFCRSEIP